MNLHMQGPGGAPQNLHEHDPNIVTGLMYDCVSVIVLYNYNDVTHQYDDGRGWHGLGGVDVVNMATMMLGVPNVPLTQVIIIAGPGHFTPHATQHNMEYVQARLDAHRNVNVRYIANKPNATVSRQGVVA